MHIVLDCCCLYSIKDKLVPFLEYYGFFVGVYIDILFVSYVLRCSESWIGNVLWSREANLGISIAYVCFSN